VILGGSFECKKVDRSFVFVVGCFCFGFHSFAGTTSTSTNTNTNTSTTRGCIQKEVKGLFDFLYPCGRKRSAPAGGSFPGDDVLKVPLPLPTRRAPNAVMVVVLFYVVDVDVVVVVVRYFCSNLFHS